MQEARLLLCRSGESGDFDKRRPLMELGLDSLAATQLIHNLSQKTGLHLSPTLLFDYPTADALSTHLDFISAQNSCPPKELSTQTKMPKSPRGAAQRIAIIGMSCRLPGGMEGLTALSDSTRAGHVAVGKVPFSRWDMDAVTLQSNPDIPRDIKTRMSFGVKYAACRQNRASLKQKRISGSFHEMCNER